MLSIFPSHNPLLPILSSSLPLFPPHISLTASLWVLPILSSSLPLFLPTHLPHCKSVGPSHPVILPPSLPSHTSPSLQVCGSLPSCHPPSLSSFPHISLTASLWVLPILSSSFPLFLPTHLPHCKSVGPSHPVILPPSLPPHTSPSLQVCGSFPSCHPPSLSSFPHISLTASLWVLPILSSSLPLFLPTHLPHCKFVGPSHPVILPPSLPSHTSPSLQVCGSFPSCHPPSLSSFPHISLTASLWVLPSLGICADVLLIRYVQRQVPHIAQLRITKQHVPTIHHGLEGTEVNIHQIRVETYHQTVLWEGEGQSAVRSIDYL